MREAFFLKAAEPISGKKVQTERGLQGVFPKTRFPEKRIEIDFAAKRRNSARLTIAEEDQPCLKFD